jgi:hypothetical protein
LIFLSVRGCLLFRVAPLTGALNADQKKASAEKTGGA